MHLKNVGKGQIFLTKSKKNYFQFIGGLVSYLVILIQFDVTKKSKIK